MTASRRFRARRASPTVSRYTAVGFQTSQSMVCAALTKVGAGTRPSTGCLGERLLPDALERQPAHLFAGGGGGPDGFVRRGSHARRP